MSRARSSNPRRRAKPPSEKAQRSKGPVVYHRRGQQRLQTEIIPTPPAGSTQFAYTPEMSMQNIYRSLKLPRSSGTGSVTTKTELGLQVVHFFDYITYDAVAGGIPQDITSFWWDVAQNLFSNDVNATGDKMLTFNRVRRLELYALPVKGFATVGSGETPVDTNATGMYTVQFQVPGIESNESISNIPVDAALATNTQVTNVLPQIDTMWKKVGQANLDKTFMSGVVRPVFDKSDQCLFQISVRDPVSYDPYIPATEDNNLTIRFKVVLHVDNPIATTQESYLALFRNEDWGKPGLNQNGSAYPGTAPEYVQINLTGKLDKFR